MRYCSGSSLAPARCTRRSPRKDRCSSAAACLARHPAIGRDHPARAAPTNSSCPMLSPWARNPARWAPGVPRAIVGTGCFRIRANTFAHIADQIYGLRAHQGEIAAAQALEHQVAMPIRPIVSTSSATRHSMSDMPVLRRFTTGACLRPLRLLAAAPSGSQPRRARPHGAVDIAHIERARRSSARDRPERHGGSRRVNAHVRRQT